jgi:hypothetical protein
VNARQVPAQLREACEIAGDRSDSGQMGWGFRQSIKQLYFKSRERDGGCSLRFNAIDHRQPEDVSGQICGGSAGSISLPCGILLGFVLCDRDLSSARIRLGVGTLVILAVFSLVNTVPKLLCRYWAG